ncbi:MAG: sugar phosphate isomerase/epimerase family protein [Planctomycetota bacterium]
MIRSAVTVSLVPEAKGGPFVFWEGLAHAFEQAESLGFDAVEIFAPGPDAVDRNELKSLVETHGRSVAAVGTGAGAVKHGLTLSSGDAAIREQAVEFVKSMIDFGAEFNAPAIIGSMQGRWGGQTDRTTAMSYLTDSLESLGDYAGTRDVPLIYEPLNRYETNLFNTIAEGVEVVESLSTSNVRLLADLFHMNIEEADVAEAIRVGGKHLAEIHFVDSNRWAAGYGHTNFDPIVAALKDIDFAGVIAVESFPKPDSMSAATKTIEAFRQYFGD